MSAQKPSSRSSLRCFVTTFAGSFIRSSLRRKIVCLALILNLLIWLPGPNLTLSVLRLSGPVATYVALRSLRHVAVTITSLPGSRTDQGDLHTHLLSTEIHGCV